jgi:FkbH-like protein
MTKKSVQDILHQTDPVNIISVETAIKQTRDQNLESFITVPIYFLSNFTISAIEPFVDYHGLKSGLDIKAVFGDYNVVHQALMRPDSELHTFNPQVVVLSLMYDVIIQGSNVDVCARLQELFDLAAAKAPGTIVLNTFISSPCRDLASIHEGSKAIQIQIGNDFIRQFVKDNHSKFCLCDWDQYVQASGYIESIDRRYWYMAKAPFKPAFLSQYAADITKIIRSISGLSKKCLVLDCDGTLWGGVIGEEGMEGINLHSNDYPGNVFFEVQRTLLDLQKRGILLAVNSKNNENDVFSVFEKHPHCLLKKEHFSAYRINWGNKSENIVNLARELNLGLDSFVFLDDSDFECDSVKTRVPSVEVRQVPKRLYEYPDFVLALVDELFFNANRTSEDAVRSELYSVRQKAEVAKADFNDIETYLKSLKINVDIHEIREAEVARIAQLTHKTNQFNLFKTPYSEEEISMFYNNPAQFIYVMVVNDRFGKLGLTNVCIAKRTSEDEILIDTFLMSCRVFERNLEYAFLNHVIRDLKQKKHCSSIRAQYKQTQKNKVAEKFYEQAGFDAEYEDKQNKYYFLDVADYKPRTFDYIRQV